MTGEEAAEIVVTALEAHDVVEHIKVSEFHGSTIYVEINGESFVVRVASL